MTPSDRVEESRPAISIIVPCFDEEEIIRYTIPRIASAFERAGYDLELVAVDNGSRDATGSVIRELARNRPTIVPFRVEVNEGYGNGVLRALEVCTAPWVGVIPADGEVDAEDFVLLYESAVATRGNLLVKVRRRFRMDGVQRKIISLCF